MSTLAGMNPRVRAEVLYREQRGLVLRHTHLLLRWLMLAQWIAAGALWATRDGAGPAWVVALVAAVTGVPLALTWTHPDSPFTRHGAALGQMFMSSLLIQMSGARPEALGHVFGSLVILAFYRDMGVILTASAVAVSDAAMRSLGGDAGPWPAVEQSAWILFADVFLVFAALRAEREIRLQAERQAEIECLGERRYEALVNSVDGIVWEADARTMSFTFVSPQAERILGLPIPAWIEVPDFLSRRLHPADRDRVIAQRGAAVEALSPYVLEYRLSAADGREVWVHDAATVVARHGEAVVVRGLMTDITASRQAERLQLAQHALTRIVAGESDEEGGIRSMLEAAGRALGWGRGSLWLVDEAAGLLQRAYGPDDEPEACSFRLGEGLPGQVWASGRPQWVPDVVRAGLLPGAEKAEKEGYYAGLAFPVVHGGRILGVVSFLSPEIREPDGPARAAVETMGFKVGAFLERRRAEEALRRSEERFRRLAEDAPVGIFMTGEDGGCLYVNAQWSALTGLSREEAQVDGWAAALHPEDREAVLRAWGGATLESRDFEGEYRYRRPDGTVVWVAGRAVPVREADGRTAGFLGCAIDITERKRMDRLKSEFVSTVSHELRTPLTSIRGSLKLIASGRTGEVPQKMRAMVDIAYESCERLVHLVNDILDMEKIESGRMSFDVRSVDADEIGNQAVTANRPFADTFGVRLRFESLGAGMRIRADGHRVMQVLTNLISNAVKFSPRGEAVEVRVTALEGAVRFAVADRGPGIPHEFRPRIFQKFAQADGSDARLRAGTGLGLSISKALVERLGGRIGFDSETGRGTTFFVEFPEEAAAPAVVPASGGSA